MLPRHKHIARQQLDKTLSKYDAVKCLTPPAKGWLKAVRESLGMTGQQLASFLGVSQPRIHKLEQSEVLGAVSLKTMREAAEAMDCVFVYAVVPRTTLEDTIKAQARKVVEARLKHVSHSMLLEAQELSPEEQSASLSASIDEIVREMPKELWEARP